MKTLGKRVILSPLRRFAWKIVKKIKFRKNARFTKFQYDSDSVLQCCIAYNKHGGFCVPLSSCHRPAAQKILSGDIHEPSTIEFLTSNSNGGDIVHAGTYFGDFLPALSRSLAPDAKVWAFEPNPENYRCALITTCINELQNVELTNAGLGERQDSLSMVTSDIRGRSLGGGSWILKKGNEISSERKEMVQIVTVDEMIPLDRKVSIIHLDVEGHEKQALIGALKTIQRCLPIILLETLPEQDWLTQNILYLGYKISGMVHDNTILIASSRTLYRT